MRRTRWNDSGVFFTRCSNQTFPVFNAGMALESKSTTFQRACCLCPGPLWLSLQPPSIAHEAKPPGLKAGSGVLNTVRRGTDFWAATLKTSLRWNILNLEWNGTPKRNEHHTAPCHYLHWRVHQQLLHKENPPSNMWQWKEAQWGILRSLILITMFLICNNQYSYWSNQVFRTKW